MSSQTPVRTLEPEAANIAVAARLVVVANRLPVELTFDEQGDAEWRRAPGGLVSALDPVMRDRDALWIGWGGRI